MTGTPSAVGLGDGSPPSGGDRSSARWHALFLAAVLGEVALAWAAMSRGPMNAGLGTLPFLVAGWAGVWLVALRAALRLPGRRTVGLIMVAGMALRLAALAGPPTTSDDLFRYSWDGRVQAAGIDSYAQSPAATQRGGLRERWLWPDRAGCAALARSPGCTRINRPDARTIYPPVAETWFAAVYRVSGIGARHKAWQVAGLVTEMATIGLLVAALRRWGRDPRWLALYALCPAPVIEIVNNGHVDGLAIALIVAALIVVVPADGSAAPPWRDIAAGALVGGAILVKLYPAVLLVPFVACRPGRRLPGAARVGATVAAMTAVAYAPHVARVGSKVLGYLPGYLGEEHYRTGGRYLIANLLQVPPSWAGLVSLVTFGLVAGWVLRRRPPLPLAAGGIVAALLLASSPAQPWYAVTLLALATVAARPAWATVVAAGYVASFAVVLDRPGAATTGGLAYAAALALIVATAASRVRRRMSGGAGGADNPYQDGSGARTPVVRR